MDSDADVERRGSWTGQGRDRGWQKEFRKELDVGAGMESRLVEERVWDVRREGGGCAEGNGWMLGLKGIRDEVNVGERRVVGRVRNVG